MGAIEERRDGARRRRSGWRVPAALLASLGAAACAGRTTGAPASGPDSGDGVDRRAALFTEMMARVDAGDAAGYAQLYAEDAVITIHGAGKLEGRASIEQHEVELLRQFPGTHFAIYDLWQDGAVASVHNVVAHYAVHCPNTGGPPLGHEGLLFYRFDAAGRIADERRYLDSRTILAQLGLLGAQAARTPPDLAPRMGEHSARGSDEERENAARVRTFLEAWDRKDEPSLLALLADDVVYDELLEPQVVAGKTSVGAAREEWTRAVPDAHTEVVTLLAVGEHVLAETIVRGTLRAPLWGLAPSDQPFAVHRAALVELGAGKITRFRSFLNSRELAEALGQWPPARR